jgi:hypothetical protein
MDDQGWTAGSRRGIVFDKLALGLTKFYSSWLLGPPFLMVKH